MNNLKQILENCQKKLRDNISQVIRTEYISSIAVVMAICFCVVAIYLANTEQRNHKITNDVETSDENIFELDLDDEVKTELNKGFSSFGGTMLNGHMKSISENIAKDYLPFYKDVYLVLSNQSERGASVEENTQSVVMAAPAQPETPVQPPVETPAQQPTETPAQPPVEVPTEPETEVPTFDYTEPETITYYDYETTEEVLFSVYDPNFTTEDMEVQPEVPEAVANDTSGPIYTSGYGEITPEEYYWLRQIVQAEAGNQDEIGRILVANVIINRVRYGYFPATIKDVIFQNNGRTYQFEPVLNGMIYSVVPDSLTISAVDKALAGEDYSQGALYFCMQTSPNSWFNRSLTLLFVHGAHWFYR